MSLALLASTARRRHSSARRRKCSILTCFLPADRSLPSSVGNATTVIQSSGDKRLNFSRGCAKSLWRCSNRFGRRRARALHSGRRNACFEVLFGVGCAALRAESALSPSSEGRLGDENDSVRSSPGKHYHAGICVSKCPQTHRSLIISARPVSIGCFRASSSIRQLIGIAYLII